MNPAALSRTNPQQLTLSGSWTARGLGRGRDLFESLAPPAQPSGAPREAPREAQSGAAAAAAHSTVSADATQVEALDTAGAWLLHQGLQRLRAQGVEVTLQGLRPAFAEWQASADSADWDSLDATEWER